MCIDNYMVKKTVETPADIWVSFSFIILYIKLSISRLIRLKLAQATFINNNLL